jgi:hypothetical protein
MFNPLTPSEVVTAIGVTLRAAARSEDPSDEFSRDQLMSAYSATRHLAVELERYRPEFARFTDAVAARLQAAAAADGAGGLAEPLTAGAARIDAEPTTAAVGAALAELLAQLDEDGSAAALAVRGELHALLRELADREVELLAEALA